MGDLQLEISCPPRTETDRLAGWMLKANTMICAEEDEEEGDFEETLNGAAPLGKPCWKKCKQTKPT